MSTATIRALALFGSVCLAIARASAQDPPARGILPGERPAQEITIPREANQGPVQEISLEDAMRLGLRYNTTLSAARLVPQQARQNLLIVEAFFESELFAEAGYLDSSTPTLNVFQPSLDRERFDGNFGWRNRLGLSAAVDMETGMRGYP